MSLRTCDGCQRHIRNTSVACPFCGGACAPIAAPVAEDGADPVHPGRARLMAGGVGLGLLAASTVLFGSACAVYGAPPRDDVGAADSGPRGD